MIFTLPEIEHRAAPPWSAPVEGGVRRHASTAPRSSAAGIETPELDNLTLAEIRIDTQPEHRGQGHGAAMLAHLEQVARERGRSVLTTMAAWGFDSAADGTGNPDVAFLIEQGFELSLVDIQRWLALPVDEGRLDTLAAEAAVRHPSYTLRSWVGPVPEELAQGWVELESALMTEAPMGELAWEARGRRRRGPSRDGDAVGPAGTDAVQHGGAGRRRRGGRLHRGRGDRARAGQGLPVGDPRAHRVTADTGWGWP